VELRPQKVGDSIDALENDRARKNDSYMGLCVLASQIQRLGEIPQSEITADMLMGLYEVDMIEINDALRRLQTRQNGFRAEGDPPA
jgi:hypothetical protein